MVQNTMLCDDLSLPGEDRSRPEDFDLQAMEIPQRTVCLMKMSETEKHQRRYAIIQNSMATQVQSIRDWQQMLFVIDVPVPERILTLEILKKHINDMISEIQR